MPSFCRGHQEKWNISPSFLFRPAHYSILLKHRGETVHHTRIPSQECFPSSISTVQMRRLQPEVALENCNW